METTSDKVRRIVRIRRSNLQQKNRNEEMRRIERKADDIWRRRKNEELYQQINDQWKEKKRPQICWSHPSAQYSRKWKTKNGWIRLSCAWLHCPRTFLKKPMGRLSINSLKFQRGHLVRTTARRRVFNYFNMSITSVRELNCITTGCQWTDVWGEGPPLQNINETCNITSK